jgi:Domain of unknown function (DUF892)
MAPHVDYAFEDPLGCSVKEGELLVKAQGEPDVQRAGLIGAAQRVEHYQIAGYGTPPVLRGVLAKIK